MRRSAGWLRFAGTRRRMRKLILPPPRPCSRTAAAPAPPKLLVVISVDQFSANLFDEYRPHFTGGLGAARVGTVFRNGYQSHAATETCPGHSTILTGDHPARTGIIGNTWIDQSRQRSDKTVYCAEDETLPGTSSIAYKVSPEHLLVPTLGELMKAQWPGSRNVAVVRQGPRGGDDERPAAPTSAGTGPARNSTPILPASPAAVVAQGQRARAALATAREPLDADAILPVEGARGRRSRAAASRSAPVGSLARPATRPRSALRPSSTAIRWRSRRRWSTRCSSAAAPTRTCSRSACRRPTMSAIPTAPKARRCACS